MFNKLGKAVGKLLKHGQKATNEFVKGVGEGLNQPKTNKKEK
jgi:hypothetical protein